MKWCPRSARLRALSGNLPTSQRCAARGSTQPHLGPARRAPGRILPQQGRARVSSYSQAQPRANRSAAARAPASADSQAPSSSLGITPVTVLSGFVGAGKTAVLQHLISNPGPKRLGVVVRDTSAVSMALPAGTPHVAAPAVAALGRGCTCCEKRADLVREVARLAARPDVDYVLVEAAGSAYPQEVAEALVGDGHGDGDAGAGRAGAGDGVAIDTMVTVVDAGVFLEHLAGDLEVGEVVGGVNADADADADADAGGRTVAEVLAAQVEFCDVVVVNKIDTVPGGGDSVTAQQVLAVLRKLNPTARIVLATHGHVDPTAVVGTGLFDMDRAAHSAGWMHELSAAAPTPEPSSADAGRARPARVDGRGGVESFVYRARRPFSAARLADALELPWDGLLRSKGYFWLATRGRISGLWQTAGKAWSGEPVAPWQATLPPDAREPGVELEGDWDAVWGDRQTEVVFVGVGMDEAGFRARLDGCLLSDAEMSQGEGCWAQMEDPLPPWEVAGGVH